MWVIGLTGGIGSGKTTVTQFFSDLNVPILDADQIARDVTEPHTAGWQSIIDHFGPSFLNKDGTLDRRQLRRIIFDNSQEKRWLEKLLHPSIIQSIEKKLKEIHSPYCIVVIPLLLETGPYPFIHRILVVDASLENRIIRLKSRDQATKDDIQKIIAAQINSEERLTNADDIIYNNNDMNALRSQVQKLHTFYSEKYRTQ